MAESGDFFAAADLPGQIQRQEIWLAQDNHHCLQHNWRMSAGCWYYNHALKRTLEAAGFCSQSRLLHFSF